MVAVCDDRLRLKNRSFGCLIIGSSRYRPRSLTALVGGLVSLAYLAFYQSHKNETNEVIWGLGAAFGAFVVYGAMHFRDGPFIRPERGSPAAPPIIKASCAISINEGVSRITALAGTRWCGALSPLCASHTL